MRVVISLPSQHVTYFVYFITFLDCFLEKNVLFFQNILLILDSKKSTYFLFFSIMIFFCQIYSRWISLYPLFLLSNSKSTSKYQCEYKEHLSNLERDSRSGSEERSAMEDNNENASAHEEVADICGTNIIIGKENVSIGGKRG